MTKPAKFILIVLASVAALTAQNVQNANIRGLKNRVYNVIDYGATGNGTTDDTAAIRRAFAAGAGKNIHIPPGTYKVTDVGGLGYIVTPAAGTSVTGGSSAMGNETAKIISYTTNVPVFVLGADDISIKGLYLEQSGTATSGSIGIRVNGGGSGCSWGSIENVTAVAFYHGIYVDGPGGLFNLTNVRANNSVSHGIVGLQAQGYWQNIDAEANIGSGIYLGDSLLGSGVPPIMDTVHVFANGRYGLEAYDAPIIALSNFYESSDSLGGLYSNVGGTFTGVVNNVNTEWTGQNPFSGWKGVTAATNANPVEITTAAAHGFTDTDTVDCSRILGNGAANVIANAITVVSPTKFTLTGVTGSGAYTPTARCISDPSTIGCARCSLSTATYRAHPTAPAIHLGSSNVGIKISNANIFSPQGEGIRNEGDYTELSSISVSGGGAGGVPTVPYSFKSSGDYASVNQFRANTPCYISGNQTLFENGWCAGDAQAAMQVAAGIKQVISGNVFDAAGAQPALQLDAGVTVQRANNIVNGPLTDNSTMDATSKPIGASVTYAEMIAQNNFWGMCTNCKPTSAVDNTCVAGGTGAFFFYDSVGAWRCVKTTASPAIVTAALTNQNAALTTADLVAAANVVAGTYRASAYIHTKTASAGACTSDVTFGWTYNSAAKTKSPISSFNQAIDENFGEASTVFRAAAGAAITYAVSRAGADCSSNVYDIYMVLERIQ